MASEQLEAYLKDLADALAAHGAWDARTIEEARAHLLDAVEAGLHRGLPLSVAEREAVTAFGPPDIVAARAAVEQNDHHDWQPHGILNRLLAASCWLTLFATAYLSLSVIVLRPPRLNYSAWFLMAGFFVAQSVLTLVTVAGSARSTWSRRVLIAGGVAIASTGAWWVHETVSGPHFEGYALILGSWVAIQGTLTVLWLLPLAGFRRGLDVTRGRQRVNSMLKSFAFWMVLVLVVVAVGVWNFSTRFEAPSRAVSFRDFMRDVGAGKIEKVTVTRQKVSGVYRADKETFHTYAPAQYEGLANQLDAQGVLNRR
jgi:hypothetical protein